jgi:hypothetical protein
MKTPLYKLTDSELTKIAESHCRLYHNCSDATRLLEEITDRFTKLKFINDELSRLNLESDTV